jgi:hypothetical protein
MGYYDVEVSDNGGHDNFGDRKAVLIARYRVKFSTEIRQNLIRLLWLHFDVVKPPIGWLLIHFSKTTSNKLPNHMICFTLPKCFCKRCWEVTFLARFDRLSFNEKMANVLMTYIDE